MPIRMITSEAEIDAVRSIAAQMNQAKYIDQRPDYIAEAILLGAFSKETCVGFHRFYIQTIGSEEGHSPVTRNGESLTEGFVIAFGVLPEHRRQGWGRRLQNRAIEICCERDCYQIRSLSPTGSTENYGLKLSMGYTIHPHPKHDAYYFIKRL